jgi:hypothetical protein
MKKNVHRLTARRATRAASESRRSRIFRRTQAGLFYACLALATLLAFSVSSTSTSAHTTSLQPTNASGRQQSTLSTTQSISLSLPSQPQTVLDTARLSTGDPASVQVIEGPPGYTGACDASLALDATGQVQNCGWIYQESNPSTTLGNPDFPVWTCEPTSPWPTPLPATLVYNCTTGGGTTYYCNIQTNTVIADLNSIQCSTTETSTGIGTLTTCTYNSMGETSDCSPIPTCAASSGPDPVTGIPTNISATNPCVVHIQSCPAGTTASSDDWLFGTNGLLYASAGQAGANTNTRDHTVGITLVQTAWGIVVAIALILLGLPLALAGFQIMQGLGSENQARAIELLGKVLLVALAIVASWTIVGWLIQLEDALAQYVSTNLSQGATTIPMPSSNWGCYAQQFFGTLYNMNVDTTNNAANGGSDAAAYAQNITQATLTLIENLPNYILTLLSVLLAIQLVVRLALLNVYIIISPLAIFCGAMPGKIGSSVTSHWIKGFASLLSVQVLQLFLLVFIGAFLNILFVITGVTSGAESDWAATLFAKLIPILVMVMTLNVPRLFNSSATTLLSTVSSSIGGAMSGIALIIRGL